MFIDKLSEILKKIMKEKKWSYQELADKTGVSKAYLTNIILHGKVPRKPIIKKIAKNLEIDPNKIKEYRLTNIYHRLENSYIFYAEDEFEQVEKAIIDKLPLPPDDDNDIWHSWESSYMKIKHRLLLDITNLPDGYQKQVMDLVKLIQDKMRIEKKSNSKKTKPKK